MFIKTLMRMVTNNNGIVNDHTDRIIPVSKVLGFCLLTNNCVGLLFKEGIYSINEVYIGPDKMIHLSEWSISGTVENEDLTTPKGIKTFNDSVSFKNRIIKRVVLLNGTTVKGGSDNE